jgi:hypothetical protein
MKRKVVGVSSCMGNLKKKKKKKKKKKVLSWPRNEPKYLFLPAHSLIPTPNKLPRMSRVF